MTDVRWAGLDELADDLRRFPEAVTREVAPLTEQAARQHYTVLRQRFPERDVSGTLRRRTRVEQTGELTWKVRNFAPHAPLYEQGFQHVTGRPVRGHHIFVPTAQSIRERMYGQFNGVVAKVTRRSAELRGA